MDDKFDRQPLSSRVCEPLVRRIVEMIGQGELQAGEQLPPQVTLARKLGVSRSALREALKELSYRGLVRSRHGVGTFVTTEFASELEVVESRKYVEEGTASLAALRASAEGIERLRFLVAAMTENVTAHDFKAFSQQDLEFHQMIAALSGNRVLQKIMQTLRDTVLQQQQTAQPLPGAIERAHLFHKRIVEAMATRDAEAAAKCMVDHLEDVAQALMGTRATKNPGNRRRGKGGGRDGLMSSRSCSWLSATQAERKEREQ